MNRKYKGYWFDKRRNKWRVDIRINNKKKYFSEFAYKN